MRSLPLRYRFLRRLGAGAAGGVYLVEDRVHGGPPIALKLLEHSSAPAFRSSFAREFAVLASLSLPGVAQVYDLGRMPSGQEVPEGPFFTRAFVDGEPLDAWARTRELEAIAAQLVRVLELVSRLHRMGIVHGDLKPANIVIDHDQTPHLIDFGLALRLGSALDARLSGSGTPLFMAPELFRGSEPSIASDVYALGATIWTLTTGRPPFAELGGGALQAKLSGMLPHAEPSAGLRHVLLQAALAALAAERRARLPSADELAAMIERGLRRSNPPPSEQPSAVFVPPRPRGREQVLEEIEQALRLPGVVALCGARGMGKSTLLRELKWRAQLEGRQVYELRFRGEASGGLQQLRAQQQPGGVSLADPVDGLLSVLDAGEGEPPAVLSIDDLELADAEFARALPLALYELGDRAPSLVVGCGEATNARLLALSPRRVWTLEALSEDILGMLVREVLGTADALLVDALVRHANGNPGLLVEALAQVFVRPDITAREVSQLRSGEIGSGLLQLRFQQLSPQAQGALALLVAARASPQAQLPEAMLRAALGDALSAVRAELSAHRLISMGAEGYRPNDAALSEWLRHAARDLLSQMAQRALSLPASAELRPVLLAELAYAAGDRSRLYATVRDAIDELRRRGGLQQALELARVALPGAPAELGFSLRLSMAELQEGLGDLEGSVTLAEALLAEPGAPKELTTRARLIAGRAHVARGDLGAAAQVLSVLSQADSGELFAPACRELARVHLRRGDREQVARVVARGLSAASVDDPARPELLAIEATLASMAGERALADARFGEALRLASALGERDLAQVLGYQAMAFERAGELSAAASTYERALSAARSAGDIGLMGNYASNYGTISFRLGRTDVAAEHYALAGRLARRAGRFATVVLAQNNLATLHIHIGAFERGQAIAEASLSDAERWGLQTFQAHALHILGDVAARQGLTDEALARYDAAARLFEQVARMRELAEVCLDAAECLLDRAGVSDASASAPRLSRARTLIEAEGIEDLRTRLKLLLARARAANGDLEGALSDLERLSSCELKEHERELGWQVLEAQAQFHRLLGSEVLARKCLMDAAEIIEREAARVPREVRDGFRAVPRRRAVLEAATATASLTTSHGSATVSGDASARGLNARLSRLLEIIKRLARERDLARLLERITDAAVELSGAERGFVLLLDGEGQLTPHTVRASAGREQDPSVAFSRSIAEAVLIDGEPIVTVNARDDRRVNEFMSVHKLALKSVACVPIRGPERVEGVLYLEHRVRAGRFQDEDLDLLLAFADQAAIALENTRLWQENEARRAALETKNRELEATKADIERLLEARTEELQQAQRALQDARVALTRGALWHGMVGQGAAMQRVFALIERVRDSAVPVVIQGESGTGKELVARAIHTAGARQKGPFIAVNCGALPEHLLESELFGHVRGAFTGADRNKKGLFTLAQGGTLFLDEFADIHPRMQLDLLRVLQEGCIRPVGADSDLPVDVRVVVAANRPLAELVKEKRLREDLFYRLSVVEIRLPPLRERPEDLALLCDHLLARIAAKHGGRARRLTRAAFEQLSREPFPGNVRQLEHMLLSAAMMCEGTSIDVRDLSLAHANEAPQPAPSRARAVEQAGGQGGAGAAFAADALPDEGRASSTAMVDATTPEVATQVPSDLRGFKQRERQRILDALERHGWNRVKAATALGMPRRTFYRRLSEFGIL